MPASRKTATSDVESPFAPTPFQLMVHAMTQVATADETGGRFSGDDLTAILSAETDEEIWEADDRPPLNFQHLAGCEIEIIDFSVKYSRGSSPNIVTPFTAEDGRKMYLLCTVQRLSRAGEKKILRLPDPGEVFVANTSARYVVAKIWAFWAKGKIDPQAGTSLRCMVQETDLGGDQAVLKLRPIATSPVQSTVA
jgi:hypothetical protein